MPMRPQELTDRTNRTREYGRFLAKTRSGRKPAERRFMAGNNTREHPSNKI